MNLSSLELLGKEAADLVSMHYGSLVEREGRSDQQITAIQKTLISRIFENVDQGSPNGLIWIYETGDANILWEVLVDHIWEASKSNGMLNVALDLDFEPPLHFAEAFLAAGLMLAQASEQWLQSEDEEQRLAATHMLMYSWRCHDMWTDARGPKKCRNPTNQWLRVQEGDKRLEERTYLLRRREENSARGKRGIEFRHNQSGGYRHKAKLVKTAWASGLFETKDECARAVFEPIGISQTTARNHLKGEPEPQR